MTWSRIGNYNRDESVDGKPLLASVSGKATAYSDLLSLPHSSWPHVLMSEDRDALPALLLTRTSPYWGTSSLTLQQRSLAFFLRQNSNNSLWNPKSLLNLSGPAKWIIFNKLPPGVFLVTFRHPFFSDNSGSKPTVVLEVAQTIISADCTNRPSVTINGTSPGPELRFKEGQRVVIRVINRLKDHNTTIHFHGLSQFGSPFADGTQKISQFAIAANGGYFDYEFQLELGSAGTYMYHAHVGFQISSAYAPFIVEDDSPPPFKYAHDITLLFGDYYHRVDDSIANDLEAAPFKWLGEPQSLVVNGNALGSCNSSSLYGCTQTCQHHNVVVKPDTVYRVRVIGITVLTYLYFGIENHSSLFVIEADGGYVKPAETDHIQLHSGQRYSFLLKTKSKSDLAKLGKKQFWGRIESRWRPIRDQGAFVLRYEDDSNSKNSPISKTNPSYSPAPVLEDFKKLVPLPDEGNKWLTKVFQPFNKTEIAPTSAQVNRRLIITGQQRKQEDGSIHWYVNGEHYVETQPNIPFLVQAYTRGLKPNYEKAKKNNGYDPDLAVYPIKLNDVVEFVFINQASTANVAEAHPWHLHGQKAFMIAEGYGEFSDAKLHKAEASFNKTHILRDTQVLLAGQGASYTNTTVPSGTQTGWMVLRMRANTPGAFLFHCHTQPHALMGMAGVFLIGIEHLPPLPPGFLNEFLNANNTLPPRFPLRKRHTSRESKLTSRIQHNSNLELKTIVV
ncbi:hypothetical protein O181_016914 [Austropuccinia psidii MF-1]|uniref:laccase n=1 Tax=Austropuccinia psidii MF-1 TaxID=1389203 RepID=A0A9Q3C4T7_9BASI|nr:hypothetical protein [Austropuccinia psidii MF-1]